MKRPILITFIILSLFQALFGKVVLNPGKELSADEYKVFTDFFNTEKFSGIDVPQFFEYTYKGNTVFEKTTVLDKKKIQTLDNLKTAFGKNVPELMSDLRMNNQEKFINREKIPVKRIAILTQAKQDEAIKEQKELSEVPSGRLSDVLYLSGVGFNKVKNEALFFVLHSGSPRTSYWVLMGKSNAKWEIKKVVLDNMIIY